MDKFIRILILLLTALSLHFTSNAEIEHLIVGGKLYPPPATIDEMIANVREMDQNNAPRKEIVHWMTIIVDGKLTNMNSPELIFDRRNLQFWRTFQGDDMDGTKIFDGWRKENIFDNDKIAKWAWDNEFGNCEEHANLQYYILKKAGVKGNYRIFSSEASRGHAFTVWGLKDGSDPNNPATWGPDAYAIDSWLGQEVNAKMAIAHKYYKNSINDAPIKDATYNYDKQSEKWEVSEEYRSASTFIDEDCFVATAAFGTPLASEIQVLREFRDQHMRKSAHGRLFIQWYEKNGPPLAAWINRNPWLKKPVRIFVIQPIVNRIKTLHYENHH